MKKENLHATKFATIGAISFMYLISIILTVSFMRGWISDSSTEHQLYELTPNAHGRDVLQYESTSLDGFDQAQLTAQIESAKALALFKANIPRYNFHFQPVNKTFNPTNWDYLQSIIMIAGPGVIIAILSCLCGCCFCVFRCGCGLCGGRGPKEGGYSLRERYIPKQFMIAITLIVVAAVVFGWISNGQLSDAVSDFFQTVIDTVDDFESKINRIANLLQSAPGVDPQDIQDAVDPLLEGLGQFQDVATTVQEQANKYNKYREIAINVSFVVAGVSTLFGALGAITNKGFFCKIMFALSFLSLFVLWLSFGIHLPLGVILADACLALDSFLQQQGDSDPNGVGQILACLTNDTYTLAFDVGYSGLDDALAELNNVTVSCCGVFYTVDNISSLNASSFPPPYDQLVASQLGTYSNFLSVIDDLASIANCTMVRNAFNRLKYIICVKMLRYIDLIMGCDGVIGIMLFPGIYCAIVGWKRFPNPKKKAKAKDAENGYQRGTTTQDQWDHISSGQEQYPMSNMGYQDPTPSVLYMQDPIIPQIIPAPANEVPPPYPGNNGIPLEPFPNPANPNPSEIPLYPVFSDHDATAPPATIIGRQ